MINLRYHIVSITAVFLALGIGLTLGSTFLDRVTVDTLKAQLDSVQAQVDDTRERNEELQSRVDRFEERDDALASALSERLLADHLEGVPVLVLATRGTDEDDVALAIQALGAAGAEVAGTWWLTERWELDDEDEVTELATLLDLTTDDVERLRRNAAIRLAELLTAASEDPAELDPQSDPEVQEDPPVEEPALPEPNEPDLVAELVAAGFVEYEAPPGANTPTVLLPGARARFVVISGSPPGFGPQPFAAGLIDEMAAEGPARVVAAQSDVHLEDDGEPVPEDGRRTTFVGPIREGDLTRERISTIDDLDTAAGLAALVLAVEDLTVPTIGHYGVAPGASTLLPGPATEP